MAKKTKLSIQLRFEDLMSRELVKVNRALATLNTGLARTSSEQAGLVRAQGQGTKALALVTTGANNFQKALTGAAAATASSNQKTSDWAKSVKNATDAVFADITALRKQAKAIHEAAKKRSAGNKAVEKESLAVSNLVHKEVDLEKIYARVIKGGAKLSQQEKELAKDAAIHANYENKKAIVMRRVTEAMVRLNASGQTFTKEQKEAYIAAAALGKKLGEERKALDEVRGAVEYTGGATEKTTGSWKKWAKALAVVTLGVLALKGAFNLLRKAFSAISAFAKSSIKTFAEFNYAMSEVWTLTDQSKKGMEGLSKSVRDFAVSHAVPATDAARALYQTISAGFGQSLDAAAGTEVMSKSLMFAKATMTTASKSVDLMTTVLNAYTLEASDAAYVSDVLFKTIKLGKTTGPELALSFGRVASMAAAASVPLEDLSAAVVALTRAGLKTDEAMTALRQVINKIVNPTEGAIKAVHRLGLELFSEETLTKRGGLLSILEEISEVTEFTSKDLQALSDLIPNIRAVTGIAAMSRQLEDLPDFLREFAEAEGAAVEAANKVMGTFKFHLDQVASAWDNLKISVGEYLAGNPAVIGVLKATTEALMGMAKTLTNMARDPEHQLRFFNAIIEISSLVVKALQSALGAIGNFMDALAAIGSGVSGSLLGIEIAATPEASAIKVRLDAARKEFDDFYRENELASKKVKLPAVAFGPPIYVQTYGGDKKLEKEYLEHQATIKALKEDYDTAQESAASWGETLSSIGAGPLADMEQWLEDTRGAFKRFQDAGKAALLKKNLSGLNATLSLLPANMRKGAKASLDFANSLLELGFTAKRALDFKVGLDIQPSLDGMKRAMIDFFFWQKKEVFNVSEAFKESWGKQSGRLEAVTEFAEGTKKILIKSSNDARTIALEQAADEVKGVRAKLVELAEDRGTIFQKIWAGYKIGPQVAKLAREREANIHKKYDQDIIDDAIAARVRLQEETAVLQEKGVADSRERALAVANVELMNAEKSILAAHNAAEDKSAVEEELNNQLVGEWEKHRANVAAINAEWDGKDLASVKRHHAALRSATKAHNAAARAVRDAERREGRAKEAYEEKLVTLKVDALHKYAEAFAGTYQQQGQVIAATGLEEIRLVGVKYANLESARVDYNQRMEYLVADLTTQLKDLEAGARDNATLTQAEKDAFAIQRAGLQNRIDALSDYERKAVDLAREQLLEETALRETTYKKWAMMQDDMGLGAEMAFRTMMQGMESTAQMTHDLITTMFDGLASELESAISSSLVGTLERDEEGRLVIKLEPFDARELGLKLGMIFANQVIEMLVTVMVQKLITAIASNLTLTLPTQLAAANINAAAAAEMLIAANIMAGAAGTEMAAATTEAAGDTAEAAGGFGKMMGNIGTMMTGALTTITTGLTAIAGAVAAIGTAIITMAGTMIGILGTLVGTFVTLVGGILAIVTSIVVATMVLLASGVAAIIAMTAVVVAAAAGIAAIVTAAVIAITAALVVGIGILVISVAFLVAKGIAVMAAAGIAAMVALVSVAAYAFAAVGAASLALILAAAAQGGAALVLTGASALLIVAATMLIAAASMQMAGGIGGVLGWLFGFSKGGVMPGEMTKKYAAGGVANSPQLALFGDGVGAEAFVPLPDGRSIPVDLGQSGGRGPSVGNVNVKIEANDTKGFDRLLDERQDLIVSLITQAVDQSLSTRRRFQM